MSKIAGIVETRVAGTAYGLYATLARRDLVLHEAARGLVPRWLSGRVSFLPYRVEWEDGGWYQIHETIIARGGRGYYRETARHGIGALARLLRSERVVQLYRRRAADVHRAWLELEGALRWRGLDDTVIAVPAFGPSAAAVESIGFRAWRSPVGLSAAFVLVSVCYFVACWLKLWVLVPIPRRPARRRLLKSLTKGFDLRDYDDSVFVDGELLRVEDCAFFSWKLWHPEVRERARVARARGYLVCDPRQRGLFLFSRACLIQAWLVALGPLVLGVAVATDPWLLGALGNLLLEVGPLLRMLSRVEPDFVYDSGDETNGLAGPLVAEWLRRRAVLQSHADTLLHAHYAVSFTAHQVLFLWGRKKGERCFRNTLNDEVYAIGCHMANCFTERDPSRVRGELGLDARRPVVTFFDNSYGERFRREDYEAFMEALVRLAGLRRGWQVVLKTKGGIELGPWRGALDTAGVRLVTSGDVWLGDIVRASSACVGMGITNVTQVALHIGARVVLFDTSGCWIPEYEAYEGILVVRDADRLNERLASIVDGGEPPLEIPVLADYNVAGVDSFSALRRYFATGRLEERYRLRALERHAGRHEKDLGSCRLEGSGGGR